MEVREHFYADDPAHGPGDARTTLRDVDYFFLGNGLIQAAVQVAPAGDATPVGLLLMDPERFGPKRAALSFDPEAGIAATSLTLIDRGRGRSGPPGFGARSTPGSRSSGGAGPIASPSFSSAPT
jgi:hypothetical protein